MIEKIQAVLNEIQSLTAKDEKELESLRIKYLGKKGIVNEMMAEFRSVPAEQKRAIGMQLNELKNSLQEKINGMREELSHQHESEIEQLDLTRSPYPIRLGTRHPLSIVKNEIIDIFSRMGFLLADGPEVEDDWHVFSSMNFAPDHPARDMQDTFFIEQHPDIILRTHTSSVQSRVMESTQPPIKVICPGRVYRNEAISSRAHCFFHQVEGLYVDKDVTLDRRLLKKYGKSLYIDGDLTLDEESAPFLEELSYVYVTGTVTLPASLAEAFDEIDGVFDEIEVLSGSVVQNKVTVRLTPSMLASSPDGLTIRNCAHVQVDESITPEELEQANLTIENCAQISCTPKQRGAIELASKNVASISEEATSIADMLKGVLGSKVVNADHYVL